jgi:hypothetical protein
MVRQQESRGREVKRGQHFLRPNSGNEGGFQPTTGTVVGDTGVGKRICQRELANNSTGSWDVTSDAGDSASESEWLIIDGRD